MCTRAREKQAGQAKDRLRQAAGVRNLTRRLLQRAPAGARSNGRAHHRPTSTSRPCRRPSSNVAQRAVATACKVKAANQAHATQGSL